MPDRRDAGASLGLLPHPPFLWRLPVLVASREGYRNLCRLITRMKLAAPKGEGALQLEDLDGLDRPGWWRWRAAPCSTVSAMAWAGCSIVSSASSGARTCYVELQRHLHRDEELDNQALRTLASAFRVPILATNGVRFATPEDRAALRRAHLRPAQDHARRAPGSSWRATPSTI